MQVKDKNRESGHAGKPGEATAGKAEAPVSAAAVTSLLQSEFAAKEEAEPKETAEEAQAVTEGEAAPEDKAKGQRLKAEVESEGEEQNEGGEEETAEDAEHAESQDQTEGEEQEGAQEEGQEDQNAELPQALREAIDQWEQSGGGELPAALQKLVEKRLNKLTGQREEERRGRETAEARVGELEAEVAKLRESGGRGEAAPAAVGHLDEKALRELEGTSMRFVQDAENFLDGTATAEEEGRVRRYMESQGLDEKGLKRMVRDTNRYLSTELPEQRKRLQEFRAQEAKVEPVAKQYFPWLDKKDSPQYQQAQEVLKWMPELRQRVPGHKIALGVYVLGLQAFEELKKMAHGKGANGQPSAKATPKKAPARPPVAGAAAPQAAARNGRQAQEDSVRAELNQRPTRETAAKLLALELQGR